MDDLALRVLLGLIVFAVHCLVLFLIVRAATISALRKAGPNLGATNELLRVQVDLVGRMSRHSSAQSELMLITARHHGIGDDQLTPVLRQLDERPAPGAFYGLPYQ